MAEITAEGSGCVIAPCSAFGADPSAMPTAGSHYLWYLGGLLTAASGQIW